MRGRGAIYAYSYFWRKLRNFSHKTWWLIVFVANFVANECRTFLAETNYAGTKVGDVSAMAVILGEGYLIAGRKLYLREHYFAWSMSDSESHVAKMVLSALANGQWR